MLVSSFTPPPLARRLLAEVADPADQPLEVGREIRDYIRARVTTLLRHILT